MGWRVFGAAAVAASVAFMSAAAFASDARFLTRRDAPSAAKEHTYLAPSLDPRVSTAARRAPHLKRAPSSYLARLKGRPAMWRLSDGDSVVWIFGSVHALPSGLKWRRPALMRAFRRADVIYFETDQTLDGARAMSEEMRDRALLKNGRKLSGLLSEAGRKRLKALIKEHSLNTLTVDAMAPWFAAFRGLPGPKPKLRSEARFGVDSQLFAAAISSGKEIRAFRSARDQLGVLADMPLDAQIAFLEHVLKENERERARRDDPAERTHFEKLVENWLLGDVEAIARKHFSPESRFPLAVRRALLDDRNANWANEIDRFMAGEGSALVIGGAAHFAGPNNVIELLEKMGWRVERM